MGRLRQGLSDSGIALPIVIMASALLVVVVTGGFWISSQLLYEAQLADSHDVAFQAASSGVVVALADLRARLDSLPAQATYEGTLDSSAAAYAVVVTLNSARSAYDCTATGTAADGAVEVVYSTFSIVPAGSGPQGGSIWGKDIFLPGTLSGAIVANGTMTGPIYIALPGSASENTLDLGSSAAGFSGGPISIENGSLILKNRPPAPIDVYTNGTITLQGSVKNSPELIINHGWDPSYVTDITPVEVAPFLASALSAATAQSSDNKMGYPSSGIANYESQPAAVPASYASLGTDPPNNRPAGWLRSRAPGASQAYKVVTGGLTIDSSTPSFGSWSGDGHYPTAAGLHDDFAYDAAAGVLYVEGIVYIGGDLVIDAGKRITYIGSGTIVCAGGVTIRSDIAPATLSGADGSPEPDAGHIMGVFSARNITVDRNGTLVTAAMYTPEQIDVTANNVTLKGSFIAERGMTGFPNGLNLTVVPAIGGYAPQALPTGQSGSGGASGAVATLDISGWRRR